MNITKRREMQEVLDIKRYKNKLEIITGQIDNLVSVIEDIKAVTKEEIVEQLIQISEFANSQ